MENPALSLARFCARMARQEARDLENEAYERDIDNAFDAIQMPNEDDALMPIEGKPWDWRTLFVG